MKQYLFILLFAGSTASGQVAVGKSTVTSISSILEFGGETATNSTSDAETSNFRGLVLPSVTASPVFPVISPVTNNPQNGTFLFDKQIMKVRMFENGRWIDMTDTGSVSGVIGNAGAESGTGTVIGSAATPAQGVLVLESSDRALVLPHIKDPAMKVKNPYPGMMCYDTVSNSLAVFDGINWSYWK